MSKKRGRGRPPLQPGAKRKPMAVSVPADLRARMKAARPAVKINWSQVAGRAFEAELARLACAPAKVP